MADGLVLVYNCSGEVICEFGGIDGRNTCADFETEATNPVVLFPAPCDIQVILDEDRYQEVTDAYSIISANIVFSIAFFSGSYDFNKKEWMIYYLRLNMLHYYIYNIIYLLEWLAF